MIIQGIYYPSDFEAKKAMIEIAARMDTKEYAIAGDGSLSVRVGPNAVWITTAGADKGALTQDMLVRVDLNGKQAMSSKARQLPEDLPIHLKLYMENREIAAVLHGYPPKANLFAIRNQSVPAAVFSPAIRALGRVSCLSTCSAEEVAKQAAAICKSEHGMLLQNDGCILWGSSIKEAYQRMEALESLSGMLQLLGAEDAEQTIVYSQTWDVRTEKESRKQAGTSVMSQTDAKREASPVYDLPGVTPLVKPGETPLIRPGVTPQVKPTQNVILQGEPASDLDPQVNDREHRMASVKAVTTPARPAVFETVVEKQLSRLAPRKTMEKKVMEGNNSQGLAEQNAEKQGGLLHLEGTPVKDVSRQEVMNEVVRKMLSQLK